MLCSPDHVRNSLTSAATLTPSSVLQSQSLCAFLLGLRLPHWSRSAVNTAARSWAYTYTVMMPSSLFVSESRVIIRLEGLRTFTLANTPCSSKAAVTCCEITRIQRRSSQQKPENPNVNQQPKGTRLPALCPPCRQRPIEDVDRVKHSQSAESTSPT